MIKAVIFDMDGLLIDSEPFWRKAAVEIFNKLGAPVTIDMMKQSMSLRVDEAVAYWHKRYPWESPEQNVVADMIVDRVTQIVHDNGTPMRGVQSAIDACKAAQLPIAIASSSSPQLIATVIDKLQITDDISVICSAYDEKYGKPHPAVFLTTLSKINATYNSDIHLDECLVLEDSINGILAAKAAKMKCIAIPEPELRGDKRLGIADLVLDSLEGFSTETIASV